MACLIIQGIKVHSLVLNAEEQSMLQVNLQMKEGKYKGYLADIGTCRVPETYANPAGKMITLPVIRVRSKVTFPAEPVFFLNGGPGLSNLKTDIPAWIIDKHDFVLVGYRGVDGSPILDCTAVQQVFKKIEPSINREYLEKVSAAFEESWEHDRERGINLSAYSIPNVIEDMESVRKALGYQKIDLFSNSYGTRVAYIYSLAHPGSLNRSVMIGVNPPGHFVWEPAIIDKQLGYYRELRKKNGGAKEQSVNILHAMETVLRKMPARWAVFSINPAKVRVLSFVMLFHQTTAPMVFDAYVKAAHGDPSGLAMMSMMYGFMIPKMLNWSDLVLKGGIDADPARNYALAMDPPNAILGSPLSKLFFGSISYNNKLVSGIPPSYRQLNATDVETLMINGTADFSTPLENAQQLLPYLKKGKLVALPEMGHVNDILSIQPDAFRHLVTTFYDTGNADSSVYKYEPIRFKPRMSLATMAKAGVGVGTIILGGILVLGIVGTAKLLR
jgi:pimeloyl-ACP methyl ester carboxylesterase